MIPGLKVALYIQYDNGHRCNKNIIIIDLPCHGVNERGSLLQKEQQFDHEIIVYRGRRKMTVGKRKYVIENKGRTFFKGI